MSQARRIRETEGAGPDEVAALRESRARLERIARHASDLIAEFDANGRLLFVSENCSQILGTAATDLIGHSGFEVGILEKLHPEDGPRMLEALQRQSAGAVADVAVYRYLAADDRYHWFESRWRAFDTEEGRRHTVVISRDVSDREEALARLRRSEQRYELLARITHDVVVELDGEGRVLFLSPAVEDALGYRPDELVGTTPFGLLHPEDVEALAETFLERVTAEHEPRQGRTFRARHRDGSWRWLRGGGVNYQTESGEQRVVGVLRDVTDRIRDLEQRMRLEEWVEQTQKLESLGMMAAGIAHDFNNLLTPILGDASLALMDLPSSSPARERLERIQRAAHHASSLTHQLLDYAGIGELDARPLELSRMVDEIGELLGSAVAKRAELCLELPEGLPPVAGDARQLAQVALNLVGNAAEAIEAGGKGRGRISVRTGVRELRPVELSSLVLGEQLQAGSHVWLEVEDDGCGMADETRARIFDPFFTTKFTGRGLGLAAVLGIVRKHGGGVVIESGVESGTRIRVYFPAVEREPSPAEAGTPTAAGWRGRGRVLVADDDAGVRDFLCETLSRAGLEVAEAADGRAAVEAFRSDARAFDLVVLDQTMPGASGAEALSEIRAMRPEVPVLLVSGFSRDAPLGEQRERCRFVQKPFLPEDLLDAARALIED